MTLTHFSKYAGENLEPVSIRCGQPNETQNQAQRQTGYLTTFSG